MSITDGDVPTVTVSFRASIHSVAEGNSITVTVDLSADPERTVTIPITRTPQDGATSEDYSGVPGNITFNSGDTEKSFTFSATQDSVDDDGESVKLTFGSLPTLVSRGTTNETVVSITDDDGAGVTVNPTSLLIDEGNSATYTVVLDTQPTHTVTVTVNDPADNTDVTAEPASLDFTTTDWSTAQTVTVSAAQDDDSDNETATVTHTVTSTDPNYSGISASSVTVSVTDDEAPGVRVSFGQAAYTVAEGADTAVTVKLSADPEQTVTILITQARQGGATATDYSGVPASVVFNSGQTERSFTVTAVDDEVDDDGEMVELGFRALPTGFIPGTPANALLNLMDDDITPPEPVWNQCPNDSGERMVQVRNGNISQPGESEFWRLELDLGRLYVVEVLGSDGGPDTLGEANPGDLTLSDPHLHATWSGDGSESFRRTSTNRRTRYVLERGRDFSGFHQFEVRSFGGNTGTYQIKIRVNNICVMIDGKAIYSYSGGPDGYRSDRPGDPSTRNTFSLRPPPSKNISRSFIGFLGDNWEWYWDQVPDEDWFAIEGVSEDFEIHDQRGDHRRTVGEAPGDPAQNPRNLRQQRNGGPWHVERRQREEGERHLPAPECWHVLCLGGLGSPGPHRGIPDQYIGTEPAGRLQPEARVGALGGTAQAREERPRGK